MGFVIKARNYSEFDFTLNFSAASDPFNDDTIASMLRHPPISEQE